MSWPPKPGEIWCAIDSWRATSQTEISIREGDLIVIVEVLGDPEDNFKIEDLVRLRVLAPGGVRIILAAPDDISHTGETHSVLW